MFTSLLSRMFMKKLSSLHVTLTYARNDIEGLVLKSKDFISIRKINQIDMVFRPSSHIPVYMSIQQFIPPPSDNFRKRITNI